MKLCPLSVLSVEELGYNFIFINNARGKLNHSAIYLKQTEILKLHFIYHCCQFYKRQFEHTRILTLFNFILTLDVDRNLFLSSRMFWQWSHNFGPYVNTMCRFYNQNSFIYAFHTCWNPKTVYTRDYEETPAGLLTVNTVRDKDGR